MITGTLDGYGHYGFLQTVASNPKWCCWNETTRSKTIIEYQIHMQVIRIIHLSSRLKKIRLSKA